MNELETRPPDEPGGLTLLAHLEQNGWVTLTSINLPPGAVTDDQFDSLLHWAGQLHESSCWILGDLLNYGERVYGETYAQAIKATGLAEQTLINYASVCNRIPRSRRRRGLKFGVHAEVAYMTVQEQEHWLKTAAANDWGRSRLREELAPIRAEAKAKAQAAVERVVEQDIVGELEQAAVQVLAERATATNGAENGSALLPTAVELHICFCAACGRSYRNEDEE